MNIIDSLEEEKYAGKQDSGSIQTDTDISGHHRVDQRSWKLLSLGGQGIDFVVADKNSCHCEE